MQCVAWNPNPALHIVALAVERKVLLVATGTHPPSRAQATFDCLSGHLAAPEEEGAAKVPPPPAHSLACMTHIVPTQSLAAWKSVDLTTAAELASAPGIKARRAPKSAGASLCSRLGWGLTGRGGDSRDGEEGCLALQGMRAFVCSCCPVFMSVRMFVSCGVCLSFLFTKCIL